MNTFGTNNNLQQIVESIINETKIGSDKVSKYNKASASFGNNMYQESFNNSNSSVNNYI